MAERFTGTVKALGSVNATSLVTWISAIPLEVWPQQSRNELRPAMVSNPEWHGFKTMSDPIVAQLMGLLGGEPYNRLLSCVMSGESIPPHVDQQADDWRVRVHVPLLADGQAQFIVGGERHVLEPGTAYLVNTLAEHSVENHGKSPRIHFMFDVRG